MKFKKSILSEAKRRILADPSGALTVKFLHELKLTKHDEDEYFRAAEKEVWHKPRVSIKRKKNE